MKGTFVKKMDQTVHKNLILSAYWPQSDADEPAIGFGLRRDYVISQIIKVFLSLMGLGVEWFLEPRTRPLLHPVVRLVLLLTPGIGLSFLLGRGRSSTGFYQLDKEGRPVRFLSPMPPESIQGRLGVSRKKFLEQTGDAE